MLDIKPYRERAGLSQMALAIKANVGQTTISAIERGEMVPTIEIAQRLARALDCTVDKLLEPDPAEPG